MRYKTEVEIIEVIEKFEACTIERGAWGHPEHLILAYHYALTNEFDMALEKMRKGIFKLLRAFDVDLEKEMPYHETLTVFWMKTIREFAKDKNGYSVEIISEMIEKYDKNYPSKFYSNEYLFSDEAKASYVEPDLILSLSNRKTSDSRK